MLRDVFSQAIAERPDMQVVGLASDPMSLLLAVGQTQAEAVILDIDDAELPGICSHLLDAYPHLLIFGVARDGEEALMYSLRPEKLSLGEITPQVLLDRIRGEICA